MTYVTQVQIYTIFKFSMTHVIEGVFCLFDVAFLLLFAAFFRGVLLDFFYFLRENVYLFIHLKGHCMNQKCIHLLALLTLLFSF